MAGSKRVGMLLVGVLLWAGLCQFGPQVPLAGERQTGAPRDHPAAGEERFIWRAEIQSPTDAEEICCQVEQPTTILSMARPGKAVKKGDLLIELDASALVDKSIQQAFDKRKAEAEMLLAKESLQREKRAGAGQVELAEKALRLARNQLTAFTEGEYPHQLALAEGAAAIAREKRLMIEERVMQLRADVKNGDDPARLTALQEAEIALHEARMQAMEAEGSLAILRSSFHDNKVAELELAVAQREFDLACAKDALSAATSRGTMDHSLAEMRYGIESDRLARLEDRIGKSRIYAPRAGTIIYPNDPNEAAIRPGAVVRERQVLVYLLPVAQPKP